MTDSGYTVASAFDGVAMREEMTRQQPDLIVLDQNVVEIDPKQIHKTKVLMTMMDGKVRHVTQPYFFNYGS